MKDYSQQGEQRIIVDYFLRHPIRGGGILLDLGANDGVTFSNSRHLMERMTWSGVFYEPSEEAFEKLQKLYADNPKAECINYAVADFSGIASFYDYGSHLGKGDTSLLSTLDPAETNRWGGVEQFKKTEAIVVDAEEILDHFDFISIDCEGMDLAIMKRIQATGVRMICVEYNGKDQDLFDKVASERFGIRLIFKNSTNLIYAK